MDMDIHAKSPTVTGASYGVKEASHDSDGTSHAPQEGEDGPAMGVSRGTSHRKKHHKVLATGSPLGYRQRSIARHQSQEHLSRKQCQELQD
jgi:hypothetical protein